MKAESVASPPRLLFVTPVSPLSLTSGAEQRSTLLYRALAERWRVDIVQLQPGRRDHAERMPGDGPYAHVLAETFAASWSPLRYRPKPALTAAVERALGRSLDDYAAVIGRYIWPSCQLRLPAHVPLVVDLDDMCYRYGRHAAMGGVAVWRERALKAVSHALARRQVHRFAAGFVVSSQDWRGLTLSRTAFLPNVPAALPVNTSATPIGGHVLFVGALWYRPNADGVNWFLRHVWPAVHANAPGARLLLVGAAPVAAREQWERQVGVRAPGFVDDLNAAYRKASLVIAPVHSGGGTNIKVLEALAHGRPCLTSDFVHAAFADELQIGRHLLVAGDARTFAEQAISVLQAPERFQGMAEEGRRRVIERFSVEEFERTVQRMMYEVVGS